MVQSAEEAEALFDEVKRYLVLSRSDRERIYAMHSLRIDDVWHQFILYTKEYAQFCQTYFGGYIHHAPSNAPKSDAESQIEIASLADFRDRYRELFGALPSDLWDDAAAIRLDRRVLNERAGRLSVAGDAEMVELLGADGQALFAVSRIAEPALRFMAEAGAFYVRELPGELDEEEKVALVAELVRCRVLRVAA